MFGEGVAPLTFDWQVVEKNPCCDCKESGMSTTCRCKDKRRYDYVSELRTIGISDEEILVFLSECGLN